MAVVYKKIPTFEEYKQRRESGESHDQILQQTIQERQAYHESIEGFYDIPAYTEAVKTTSDTPITGNNLEAKLEREEWMDVWRQAQAERAQQEREAKNRQSILDRVKGFFTTQRAKDIAKAATAGTAAGYVSGERALYASGQTARTKHYEELLNESEEELARAQKDYNDLLKLYNGDTTNKDVVSAKYVVDKWQREVDAYTKVINDEVQQKATEATTALTHDLEQASWEATQKAKSHTGKFGTLAVDAAINMIQMAGDAGVGLATGASALLPMGVRVFGQGASEAEQEGATLNQQMAYGTVAAGIELFTEKLFDGIAGIYGAGAADEITETVIRRLSRNAAGQTALRVFLNMNEEGIEEVLSDLATPLAKMIYNGQSIGESYNNNLSAADMLYDYLVGAAAAGGTMATRPIATVRDNRQANAQNQQIGSIYQNMGGNPSFWREVADRSIIKSINAGTEVPQNRQARAEKLRQAMQQPGTQQSEQQTENTGTTLVKQTAASLGVTESEQQLLTNAYDESIDPVAYSKGIEEAYTLGSFGMSIEDATERSQFADMLTNKQFELAWQMGNIRANNDATTQAEPTSTTEVYDTIEEFAETFQDPAAVTNIFDMAADTDVTEFAQSFKAVYDMGKAGVSESYATAQAAPALTDEQRTMAYNLGASDAEINAASADASIKNRARSGELTRVKGTVRGEGVTMEDLKKTFNDSQRTAYRLLSKFAQTTGVNIVLYNSAANPDTGIFEDTQGKFTWKDNTIYVDINSGLYSSGDIGQLGKYTMMRTFAHEFTHFIEKWNPQKYNEFRKFIFDVLDARGENVDDLINSKMALDSSGQMSYEEASREVIADSMMDVLQDSTLVQQLATEHQSIFKQLLNKLRDFAARMKQYYRQITTKAPREAEALKDGISYINNITRMWDSIAKGAVENYQRANGEPLEQAPVVEQNEDDGGPEVPTTRRIGIDFIRTDVDEEGEPVDLRQKRKETEGKLTHQVSRDWFPVNDFTSQEEEAPSLTSKARTLQRAGTREATRDRFPANDFASQEESAPSLVNRARQLQQSDTRTVTRDRFPENDFTSREEAGPDLKQIRKETEGKLTKPVSRDRFPANDFTSVEERGEDLRTRARQAEAPQEEPALEAEPTVADVIDASEESTKPIEPVPAKGKTEKAKEKLKKGVPSAVELKNEEAIEKGLTTRTLSIDNIVLSGTVSGLNVEQRAHLAKELIGAYYEKKDVANVSVPYDGKFTIDVSLQNVTKVLAALKAKVVQDVAISKKLDRYLSKNNVNVYRDGDDYYFSTGSELIPTTEEAAMHAGMSSSYGGYNASISNLTSSVKSLFSAKYGRVTEPPVKITFSDGTEMYRFDYNGTSINVPTDVFAYFDGGRVLAATFEINRMSGSKSLSALRIENADGELAGYIMNTPVNPSVAEKQTMPTKLKSFSKKMLADATDAKPSEPAETQPAKKTGEKAEKAPKSRFPLLQWKRGTPSQKAAYRILMDYLRKNKPLTSKDLYAICDEAFEGTQAEGKYNRKDAYDAMELAVNRYIVETMANYNSGDVETAQRAVEFAQRILANLPTQNVRTQEQQDFQQFSTPPSIAYLTAWAANITNQDHVLEPSAGIGGLLSFAKAWGAETTANELSARRYAIVQAMDFDHYFNENAEHINDILPDEIQPTVVIMNPPFSSTAGRTRSNKTSNAEMHINSALDRLSDGGRLVAVVGRGMADAAYSKYWNKLRQEYTIRANIGIDGKNYAKYGTTFDIQIVVVDKVGPQGNVKTVTGQYKDLLQVPAVLEGIRNDRSTEVERNSRSTGDQEAPVEPTREQPVHPAMAETNPADGRGRKPGNRADGRRSGKSGSADVQRTGRMEKPAQKSDTGERGAVEQQRSGAESQRSTETVGRPATDEDGVHTASRTGTSPDVNGEPEQQRYSGPESEPARGRQVEVNDDGVYAAYKTPKLPVSGAKAHPAVLVESAAMAAVDMPEATYTPHLPDSITKTGVLSDAQLASVVYAGQAHEQKLPDGQRRGFFIGDGTGVGKGRQIVGVILDNFNQGRKKAIWISEKQSLFDDAQRDWTDVTGRSKDEVKNFSKVRKNGKVNLAEGIVYTTYDTLRNSSKIGEGKKRNVEALAEWFGKNYDGVIVFDEAHNMGNLLGKRGGFNAKKGGAQMAIAAVELQKLLPNARVLYASATAATEVDGLAFASRLGLWGKGTAFSDVNDFVSKIGSAGLSAMELVVRDMKAMGMYVARSISYNGVEYSTVQHDLDPIQTEIYNTMSRAWQKTMQNVEQSLTDTGARFNAVARGRAISQYYGAIQRFYNQVLTSMSMPSVIADMRKQLASGKSCVLQIVNTNQAEADRQMAAIKDENGELDDMDLTPRGTLIDYLMKCYPVQLYEEYADEDGNTRSRPVVNSKGEPVVDKKAVAKRDALIAEINAMSIPDGPLEMLFDAFGTENVSEVSGRNRRVVPRKQPDGSIKRVEEKRNKNSKAADISAFQNGDKRILVFTNAGGTGKSYHADNRAKNKQQRVHYVLQPGWQASKAVQGFGRTHRSNEASAPIYKLVTTNIRGQKRFTSTIARRLDQLGALTKGQRDTGSGMFGASDNLETDLARDSLYVFYLRLKHGDIDGVNGPEVMRKLGFGDKFTDADSRDISKFLNRILALEVDEQNQVFDAFANIYETMMDEAIQAGTLDRGMENVRADKIEIVDDKVIYQQKGTGAATHYVQAKVYIKPRVITTVAEAEKRRIGFQGIYKTKDGDVRAVYRLADKTLDNGQVVKQYKIQSPNSVKSSIWQERTLRSAELLPQDEWQSAWDEEIKKIPEYNEEIKHMLSGSLLPIWSALPESGVAKVQRLIADDGRTFLGRVIDADQIDNVLRHFDVNRTKETYTGKSLMKKALNSPSIFQLTYDRAKLHRSRVSGEWRLEYEQPQNAIFVPRKYPGIIMERINFTDRFFIPVGEAGEKILDDMLKSNPVANVVNKQDDTVQYSRRTQLEDNAESEGNNFNGAGEASNVQYSTRQQSLSNREVLELAANSIDVKTLTREEENALAMFQERLDKLNAEKVNREELGRQYREQQFTKGGSRAEADRIYSAMKVSDSKIRSLEHSLLSLENKDMLKRVLVKARAVVEKEEAMRGEQKLRQYRARRDESMAVAHYRGSVRKEVDKLRDWLMKPSNKVVAQHVPAEIQKSVADFLESINFMSQTALRTGGLMVTKADERYLKDLKKVRDAIKQNVDTYGLYSGYADLPEDFAEQFQKLIDSAQEYMDKSSGTFIVNRMSSQELKALAAVVRGLRKFITQMNSFHNNAMFQHTYDAGEETIQHLDGMSKSKSSGRIYNFLRFGYMRPSLAFAHFGKGGQSIEHEFREGQATQADLATQIIDFAKRTYTGKEVKEWSKDVKTFTLQNGEQISLPVTHIMSLYCLNKRAQALTHIYGDGIRVANFADGGKVQLDEGHLVSIEDVQMMCETLSQRQIAVANALQNYMSTVCSSWGNYVSMRRFDVEQFTEANYFPINSDGRYLPTTADESPDNASLYALLNMSFTKEIKENAKNRIILYNIFDVFANHTASMTQYRSFALPVLDALKWFNYRGTGTSVREKLAMAFGAEEESRAGSGSKGYAEQFVINLLRAYNGTAANGDPYDVGGLAGLHRFNRAQIAFNLRVVIQQPLAVTRAAMILSPTKLAAGLGMSATHLKSLAAEMERYSGIAKWKALGFYDTNISRGLTELIKQNPTLGDRVTDTGTKGAEVADRLTWAAMWYAAKKTVNRSSYDSEADYMKAVTDLFEEVIYTTQVVDSVLTKAEFLRAKGFFPRMMGSFMSEPSATVSLLTDAAYKYTDDLQRGMSRSTAWAHNSKNIRKTVVVYVIGQILLSMAQSIMDAWRDDDEYDSENWLKNYSGKYWNALKGNIIDELSILGKIPYVSELREMLKSWLDYTGIFDKMGLDIYGNDLSNGWAQYAKYLQKAFEITWDLAAGNKTNYTGYGAVYNLIRGAAGLTGIPIATSWREMQDLWNNTVGYMSPRLKLKTYERAIERQYNELVRSTGLSQKAFEKILTDADADGSGSVTQDEMGLRLAAEIDQGNINEAQADAVWRTKWNKENSTTFEQWRTGEKKGKTKTDSSGAASAGTKSTSEAPKQQENSYETFKGSVPMYGSEKKMAAYSVWENYLQDSMTLDRYMQVLSRADTDGNDSLKQDELGYALVNCIANGELSIYQAAAVWESQGWKRTLEYWASKHVF